MIDYQTPKRVFLEYILYVLFKRKGLFLWVFLAVMLSIMLAARLSYPIYLATAKIWVHKTSTQSIAFFPDIQQPAIHFSPITAGINWIEFLNGQNMAMEVVKKYNLDELYRERALNPKTFRDKFWYTFGQLLSLPTNLLIRFGLLPQPPEKDYFTQATKVLQRDMESLNIVGIQSDVVTLSIYGPTARLAQDIANFLAEALIQRVIEAEQNAARFAIDFAFEQRNNVTVELKQAEDDLTDFQKKAGVLDINQQLLRQVTQTTSLENQIQTFQATQEKMETKLKALNDQIEGQKNGFVSHILLQKSLSERQDVLTNLAVNEKALEIALTQYEKAQKKARDLIEAEFTLKRLQREAAILNTMWNQFADKLAKLQVETVSRLKELAIEIIDPAYLPERAKKFWPRTRDNDTLAIILGIVCGLTAAFLIEYFSDTLKNEREAEEELDLPVLCSIPDFTLKQPR